MKKLLLAIVFMSTLSIAKADEKIPFTVEWKNLTLYTPVLSDPSIGYAYDFIGKESLITAEFTLADWKDKIYLTAGGLLEPSDKSDGELKQDKRNVLDGIPFVGVHIGVPFVHEKWTLGGFYARDWELGKNLTGVKTNFKIRFW